MGLNFSNISLQFIKQRKMKIKLYILLSLITLFSMSCDPEDFSQVVTIEIPPHESALAVRALFQESDTTLQLLVANSLGILDKNDFEIPKEAVVQLFEDGQLLRTFNYDPQSSKFSASINEGFGKAGSSYRLEINSTKYPSIKAEQVLPTAVPLTSFILKPDGTISSDGDRVDAIEIEFQDPADGENYYAIAAFRDSRFFDGIDTVTYTSNVYLDSNDPLVSYGEDNFLIMPDKAFNGKKYKLLIYSYDDLDQGDLRLQLITLTKDAFLFHRSMDDYYNAVDNPFAEPVNVHSNIEDGHGIFGLGAVFEVKIQ